MASVFISYCRESQEKAKSLAQDLEALGHQAWFDQALTGGQAWWNLIIREIQKCEIFAFALDPDSLNSAACKREYTYASDLKKSILPVLVADGVSLDLLPGALAEIQYVDYRREDKEALRALVKALTALPLSPSLPDPLPEPPPAPVSYLGSLRDQVEASKVLSFEEQTGLMVRLKHRLNEAKDADDVRVLLRLFRSRDDLYARVGDEIDVLLVVADAPPVAPPAPPPTEIRSTQASSAETFPLAGAAPVAEKPPDQGARTLSEGIDPVHSDGSSSKPFPLKHVWISLVAGLIVSAVLAEGDYGMSLSIEGSIMRPMWSLPAALLLSAIFVWKKMSLRPAYFKVAFMVLPVVGAVLIAGSLSLSYLDVSMQSWRFLFLLAFVPLLTTGIVFRGETESKRVSDKVAWLSLGLGLACSAIISRAVWVPAVYFMQLGLAGAFVVLILVMFWKRWSGRKQASFSIGSSQ